jgi:hypothetical protein
MFSKGEPGAIRLEGWPAIRAADRIGPVLLEAGAAFHSFHFGEEYMRTLLTVSILAASISFAHDAQQIVAAPTKVRPLAPL